MYKFTKSEVSLMELLGHMSDMDKIMCYEGWEESYWEQKVNGMNPSPFGQWLERQVHWQAQRKLKTMLDKHYA